MVVHLEENARYMYSNGLHRKKKTEGGRTAAALTHHIWNGLPLDLRQIRVEFLNSLQKNFCL